MIVDVIVESVEGENENSKKTDLIMDEPEKETRKKKADKAIIPPTQKKSEKLQALEKDQWLAKSNGDFPSSDSAEVKKRIVESEQTFEYEIKFDELDGHHPLQSSESKSILKSAKSLLTKPFDTHKPRGSIDATAKKVDWQTERNLIHPIKSRDDLADDKPKTYRVSSQENTNMHDGMHGQFENE